MAEITPALIKELREKTSAGMIDCKKALIDCDGDIEKATDFLRKKGLASAGKRAGRAAKEGVVTSLINPDGKYGLLLEFNCETDFVAKNDKFISLAEQIAEKIVGYGPEISSNENIPSDIDEMVKNAIATNGENMSIGQIKHMQIADGKEGAIACYIHSNKKIGVMVELTSASADQDKLKELGKDIAMHAAATAPMYIVPENIPADEINREKDIYMEQMKDSGKPESVLEKIIEGKIRKYYSEVCLLEQEFVKDSSKKIKDLLKEAGSDIQVENIARIQIGG